MINKGNKIISAFRKATVTLLALFVLILISSCSPETMQLCRVGIGTENSSRSLTATITDPLDTLNIYYRTIYKGTGSSYGDMSTSTTYKRLDSNGILVSQGLWDVEVLFSTQSKDSLDGSVATNYMFSGSAKNTYININTSKITVELDTTNQGLNGSVLISSYSLANMDMTVRNSTSVSVSIYKYNGSSFDKTNSSIPLNNNSYVFSYSSINLEPGLYFAVFEVNGTAYNKTGVIFVDTIGFVIRSGMTTEIKGECTTYYAPTSDSFNVIQKPSSGQVSADIKDYTGDQFKNGTYTIVDGDYTFVSTDTNNREKELSNVNVTINLNGKDVENSNPQNNSVTSRQDTRTHFKVNSAATLTFINSSETGEESSVFGATASNKNFKLIQMYQTNVIVNGGSFTIGSADSNGHISIKGCPASVTPPSDDILHSAIDISCLGGTVNLLGYDKGIIIEQTAKGIGTFNDTPVITDTNKPPKFDVKINMENTTILCDGSASVPAYGIYLDGKGLDGEIVIKIKGLDPSNKNYTIKTQKSTEGSGACIRIDNFKGKIQIILDAGTIIDSKDGYGIYLKNCSGDIEITKKDKASIIGKTTAVYINGSVETFSTNGKIEISSSNTTTTN